MKTEIKSTELKMSPFHIFMVGFFFALGACAGVGVFMWITILLKELRMALT